jgi:hypothetical protein
VAFNFFIVHDLPPAVTLLPVIFDPPFAVGKEMVTVRFTFPLLGFDDDTETTVGADGFVTLALEETACEGVAIDDKTSAAPSPATTNFFIESPKISVAYRLQQFQIGPVLQ